MSNRKKIIIVVGAVLVLLAVVLIVFLQGREGQVAPKPSPAVTVAPSPLPEHFHEEKSLEALQDKQKEVKENPILRALPHDTRYWSVSYEGLRDSKYLVKATVYVAEGSDAKKTVDRQKPYILRYLSDTGQSPNTYVVEYQASTVDSEGY